VALFLCAVAPAWGQFDDTDPLLDDTTEIPVDSVLSRDTLSVADTSLTPVSDNDFDLDAPPPRTFLSVRNGGFVGGLCELSALKPDELDPTLSGNMVVFGGQGYVIFSGWLFGGIGTSAVLYDQPSKYDEFAFGYGGLLFGYDQQFADQLFSVQARSMIGLGGLKMIRKRPDLADSTGLEILERFREENFFALRPEMSLGFQPIGFMEFRLSAAYLVPVGGEHVSDLASFNYGLHIMLGITY